MSRFHVYLRDIAFQRIEVEAKTKAGARTVAQNKLNAGELDDLEIISESVWEIESIEAA